MRPFQITLPALCSTLIALLVAMAPGAARCAWADQPDSVIATVVSRVQNSVVRIVVVRRAGQQPATNPNEVQGEDDKSMTAVGSGFVVDSKGLVATNRHVVENALAIFVGTPDGNRFRASIVGMPDKADIALLKITPSAGLPAAQMGDSDRLRVGDTVIAIGSPFGFDNSVTAGIVSSVNRNIMESPFDDYIQTDAAINHGNSGGPLFNLQGQVVGMNSVLYAPGHNSGSAGVGFAIPSNDLKFVFDRLEKYGEVRAGMIPIRTQPVNALIAKAIGAPGPGGALVVSMEARAERMNGAVKPGDIIRTFNGRPVTDPRDLNRLAAQAPIGSVAHLSLVRDGTAVAVDVPVLPLEQTSAPPKQPEPSATTLGLQFSPAGEGKPGVIISGIDRAGSAADSGLHTGDILLAVQQQHVTSPEQAMQLIDARRAAGHHFAALLIERKNEQSWIPVAMPR